MKKFFLSFAVFVMALCANAQTNQYFWYNGNLMMGNPIAQIDSVTFGEGEPADTLHIMLPRTIIKTVHDTVYITIHDTVCPNEETFHNGYRYVDLGLSVMWADANVGAENPEDYGNYYAWGEIEPKDSYHFYNYKYGQYTTMWKYCSDDNLSILQSEDDAASTNMGGNWRVPTKEEWRELVLNCNISKDTINSHPGYRFTATNGNSIFIPSASNFWYSTNSGVGTSILYWTANVKVEHNDDAFVLIDYNSERAEPCLIDNMSLRFSAEYRGAGGSVRGVFSK